MYRFIVESNQKIAASQLKNKDDSFIIDFFFFLKLIIKKQRKYKTGRKEKFDDYLFEKLHPRTLNCVFFRPRLSPGLLCRSGTH